MTNIHKVKTDSPLSKEILETVLSSKKPILVDGVAKKVKGTKYHCRIRQVLNELEKAKKVSFTPSGWTRYREPTPEAA